MESGVHFTFILNPDSGRGKTASHIPWLKNRLDYLGKKYELLVTSRQGHATELAKNSQGDIVVAIGGDGTINEVLNGLELSAKTLGIIPSGSGNDLIKSLGIPNAVTQAFDILMRENLVKRKIDIGTVFYHCCATNAGQKIKRRFINGIGIGFDAAVAEQSTKVRFVRGFAMYMVAVLMTLRKYHAPVFNLEIGGNSFSDKYLLIAVGNGRCAGGGFFLTPDAMIDDGYLDICVIGDRPVSGILKVMPKVMKGLHAQCDGVRFFKAGLIHVGSDQGFHVHADGEVISKGNVLYEVEASLADEKLSVIVP